MPKFLSFEDWDIWSSGHAKKVFYKKYVGDLVYYKYATS